MLRTRRAAAILGIVGGAALVTGSILPWGRRSLDLDRFAQLLNVDRSMVAGPGGQTSGNVAGFDVGGAVTLVAGIAVLLGAAVILLANRGTRGLGVLLTLGGLVGGGLALYGGRLDRLLNDPLAGTGPQLEALRLPAHTFAPAFSAMPSIGVYLCVLGGIVASIAGVIALVASTQPTTGDRSLGARSGLGFEERAPVAPRDTPPSSGPEGAGPIPT